MKTSGELFFIQNGDWGDEESEQPLSEEASLGKVNDFIENTPMKDWRLELVETKYEYKFDTKESEYYVFRFSRQNREDVYIRYNTYYESVATILF